jgi:hypothetical protein
VAFDDEFNGNGSPGNLAADGINWNVWSEPYAEGSTAYSYTSTAGAVITDCTDAAFESGGYLHILPVGSVAVGQGTSSNPAKGCEIDLAGATPGYWEAYVNYDNALGWADADWFCCGGNNGDTGFEIDVFELDGPVQLATVFWNSYASSQRLYTAASYLAGWHEIGVDWEAKSGYSVYIDGTNRGSANPDGCSASTPCNNPTNLRIINALTQPAFMPNSTGMLVDWIRHYTHP